MKHRESKKKCTFSLLLFKFSYLTSLGNDSSWETYGVKKTPGESEGLGLYFGGFLIFSSLVSLPSLTITRGCAEPMATYCVKMLPYIQWSISDQWRIFALVQFGTLKHLIINHLPARYSGFLPSDDLSFQGLRKKGSTGESAAPPIFCLFHYTQCNDGSCKNY